MSDSTGFSGSTTNSGGIYISNELFSQENNAVATAAANGNGHVCTDPDEHGPQGNGNGYGHNKGETAQALSEAEDVPPFTPGIVNKNRVYSSVVIDILSEGGWIPEGNDSSKHIKGHYTPDDPGLVADPNGVPLVIYVSPARGKANDAYLTHIGIDLFKNTDEEGNNELYGKLYINPPADDGDGQSAPIEIVSGYQYIDKYQNIYDFEIDDAGYFTMTITTGPDPEHNPVDLSGLGGLYFVPENEFSDEEIDLFIEAECSNGYKSKGSDGYGYIAVDAVADLPVYHEGTNSPVTVGPSTDVELNPDGTNYKDGSAVQTIMGSMPADGAERTYNLGDFTFKDYEDGSEEHFLLVKVDPTGTVTIDAAKLGLSDSPYEAFESVLEGSGLEIVWFDGNSIIADEDADSANPDHAQFYKINIANSYLKEHDGNVNLQLPVTVKGGADDGEYSLEVKACARELVTQDDVDNGDNDEWDWGNNFAFTPVEPVQVKVQSIASTVTVSTGWVYESGAASATPANPAADPDATGFGAGQTSHTFTTSDGKTVHSAAVINIRPELANGETLGKYVTLTFDGSRGDFYDKNGERLNSGEGEGFATIPASWLTGQDNPIYFVPNDDSDDHSDILINYEFSINVPSGDGTTKEFKAKGEIPIVVDAVADPAKMDLTESGKVSDFDGFVLNYDAEIRNDFDEKQYIVIKDASGQLKLGEDLGKWAPFLERATIEELRAFDSQESGAKHYFDNLGQNDIILKIKDLSGFEGADGSTDGEVHFEIPFTVKDRSQTGSEVKVTVQTIVIEQGGNNRDNWAGSDSEYDFANNIAVTEDDVTVYLAQGGATATATSHVYEGDNSRQHQPDGSGHEDGGTAIDITLTDPNEAIHEISFTLSTADGAPVDGYMAFGTGGEPIRIPQDAKLVFTSKIINGVAHYTGVDIVASDGATTSIPITPAATLAEINGLNETSGLRFIPEGDNDADVTISMSGRVVDVRSGDVITVDNLASATIIRDAVADKPVVVDAEIVRADGSPHAVVAGSTVTLNIKSTFGDYQDGSESHYIFVRKDYLSKVEISGSDFTVLDTGAANKVFNKVKDPKGIADADDANYFVVEVSKDYLKANNGVVDLPLQATLRNDDNIAKDGNATIAIKAVAVEHDGFQTKTAATGNPSEVDATNNVSVSDADAPISWATLENEFTVTPAKPVFENDQKHQNTGGSDPEYGTTITIKAGDVSEVIDSLTISYASVDGTPAAGKIVLDTGNGSFAEIASGSTITFEYDAKNPNQCVRVNYNDADGNAQSLDVPNLTLDQLTSQILRYIPDADGNHSDKDITVTLTGTTRETESGEKGELKVEPIRINVDAVADKPQGEPEDGKPLPYDYSQYGLDAFGNEHTAIEAGDNVSFNVTTVFQDLDGSENHYLFINTKYLVDGTLTLTDSDTNTPFSGGTIVGDTSAILEQINGNPGLVPADDDKYVVLQLNNEYLVQNSGKVSLTVGGTLLDAQSLKNYNSEEGSSLTFDVKAIAVEYDGYKTGSVPSENNNEAENTNNVAVSNLDVEFKWDVLNGEFKIESGTAFEDDQPDQAETDVPTSDGGAKLVITPADSTEVFTSMRLDYDNNHGDVILKTDGGDLVLSPNKDATFTFDKDNPALITGISCDGATITLTPGKSLKQLTADSLRYVPHDDNSDTDVTIKLTADTLETTIGTTGSFTKDVTVVVDAVADQPQDTGAELHVTHGKGNTVIFNPKTGQDSFEINLTAKFDDYEDGSEAHYIFVSSEYISSIDNGKLPDGLSIYGGDTATLLGNAGLSTNYHVLQVSSQHLKDNGGIFTGAITAHLGGDSFPKQDGELAIDVKFGAIEYDGVNTSLAEPNPGQENQETDKQNNVSLVDAPVKLEFARLDKEFDAPAAVVYEGDAPNQHNGNMAPANGAPITFVPTDTSEVFKTLTVDYDDGEGSLYLAIPVQGMGNQPIVIANGSTLEFEYRNDGTGATSCKAITITDSDKNVTSYAFASFIELQDLLGQNSLLRYIPNAQKQDDPKHESHSDNDVTITFSGTLRETATNEEGAFSHEVLVKVDAVADKPEASGTATNANTGGGALDPAVPFNINVMANFGLDVRDGSENHYIFISKKYLANVELAPGSTGIEKLDDDQVAIVCGQVNGAGGIPGATEDSYFVLKVDNAELPESGGMVDFDLTGTLKDPEALKKLGAYEGKSFTLDIKTVAVEHQGFQTSLTDDLGNEHGVDVSKANNVAVDDASAIVSFAAVDGTLKAVENQAYEGNQPYQNLGDYEPAKGGNVTIAPDGDSEVFTEITLNYKDAHGKLSLTDVNGVKVELEAGAKLVFTYDTAHPTECLSVEVRQSGKPSVTLSFTDDTGRGQSLTDLTGNHLLYTPKEDDNDDADVPVHITGTVLETTSGAKANINTSVTVVVDAVADKPSDLDAEAKVVDGRGEHVAAMPDEQFTVNLKATFDDYTDGSEAHYIFVEKKYVHSPEDFGEGASLVTNTAELNAIFGSLALKNGTGIHAGATAGIKNYHVIRVDDSKIGDNGVADVSFKCTAKEVGTHTVSAIAVAIEHDGYATDVDGIDGGTDRDITKENNVAETPIQFDLTVRQFTPDKVVVSIDDKWAFENDRSTGDDKYHPADDDSDRDNGVPLNITPPKDGNVVSSITFEYAMPSNGSSVPHNIVSSTPDKVTVTQNIVGNKVVVTIKSKDPYGSVGDLRFIPGDNYDNDDVDITITQIHVADPLLHTTSKDLADWGTGVAEGSDKLHVKVDAVAQAPGLGDFDVDHDSGNPVMAGEIIHITGEVSFEDTADGSEEHFILLEMQDGYYPDEVTLAFNGHAVTIPVIHYQSGKPANYTMQQLVTADDGQPHLFMKIPVDSYLLELAGGNPDNLPERMDDIKMDVAYQTRDWAAEGTALHFAAIANEDVEGVREYDADWNIINDELPFDKQLLKYVPDLNIMDNNTAITIAAQGAYVYWDEYDSDLLNFKGYVFENDRPSDHLRNPAYILDLPEPAEDIVQTYPVDPFLQPYDPVKFTGRDFGTGYQLNIPQNIYQFTLTDHSPNQGKGDFYYLPASEWASHMRSPGPETDVAIAGYKVRMGQATDGHDGYILVFIPSNEAYRDYHQENDTAGENSHSDHDYHFNYEFITNEYSPSGAFRGHKHYYGENKVIRVDAVANQAELISAETGVAEEFSLWNLKDTVSEFDLTVGFHDVDKTEDHYILVEMVPNFAFRCGSYYYRPRGGGNVSPTDTDAIYTHAHTDENGNQTFIRYYKVPVDLADIDPVTGNATVHVEFLRLPGMPSVADYPSSDLLTYGALTEDKTCSRWDSTDPTSPTFVNRKGADGELSYDNNTSVIIRNGIGNGADDSGLNPGWWEPATNNPTPPPDDPNNPGLPPIFVWPDAPNNHLKPIINIWHINSPLTGPTPNPWYPIHKPDEPGPWTPPVGPDPQPGPWTPPDIPDIPSVPRPNPDLWIASRGQGLAIQWVFENSTPLGHLEAGQYADGIWPTSIYLTDDRPNDAAYVKITIPGIDDRMIEQNTAWDHWDEIPWILNPYNVIHSRALLGIAPADPGLLSCVPGPNSSVTYILQTPGGQLPEDLHLLMFVAPDSKGEDFQMEVTWYDANDNVLSSGPVDVLVDAVAQWANFELENEDGVYGVTGETPSQLLGVDVNVGFLDQDGSESNYVLVEKIPGVLVLHRGEDGNFDEVKEVYLEGKTYFRIEPTKDEQKANLVHLEFSVNEELTSPMYVRDDIVIDCMPYTGMHIDMGTMTVEGQTGWEASGTEPANWEYTLKNNTSLNLQEDALTIVISKVNATGGNSAIFAEETDAPEQHIIYLDPNDPDNGLNLVMDGNDVLDSLVVTNIGGNGKFWIGEGDGSRIEIVQGMDIARAYLDGKIFHEQERYRDDDAKLEWTAKLHDGISDYSDVTINGTLTIVVDAVAKASEISLGYPVLDDVNHTLTQELTFADFENNEQHYAVIAPDLYRVVGKQAKVQDGNGVWQTVNVETIFSPDGDPYYGVLLDGYLDNNGTAKVQFTMHELNVPGIGNYPVISGGVSIEPNSGFFANDREPVLTNNWAINTDAKFVHEGSISSKGLGLTVDTIIEDDHNGSIISFSGTIGANDALTAARLVFSPSGAASLGNSGGWIATIVYDGNCYNVMADGSGNASVNIPFGSGGFDQNADFRIIWGQAHIGSGGSVAVGSFNHNADGKLDFTTTFTVKNQLSQASDTVQSSDAIDLISRADAAQNVLAEVVEVNGIAADASKLIGADSDTVTIRLTGNFDDVDGSESHYLMLEIPQQWQVHSPDNGVTHVHNGVSYYRVQVDNTDPNPSVDIILTTPDGVNRDVHLKSAAMSVETNGADTSYAQGVNATLHVSDVSATGLNVDTASTNENARLPLDFLAVAGLRNNDGNDELRSIRFTDRKNGKLVDEHGADLGDTLTAAQLASGKVFYLPAANYAGELDALGRPLPVTLQYEVTFGETNTGAVKTVAGQTLTLNIMPFADAPDNLSGVSNNVALGSIQPGHKAAVSANLQATFADVDGSEDHFFILHAPQGVAVLDGSGYTVKTLNSDELAALNAFDATFAGSGPVYKLALDNTRAAVDITVNLEVTTILYNGGDLRIIGASSEQRADGTYDFGFASVPDVALPPAVDHSLGNQDPAPADSSASLDSLRQTIAPGNIALENIDPDGDEVAINSLVNGTKGVDENGLPAFVAAGKYGTLYVHEDGAYHYVLNQGVYNVNADETFTCTVADAYGGSGLAEITINLETPNTAPTARDVNDKIDSVRQPVITGKLVFADEENDAVTVDSVDDNSTQVNLGTQENPLMGFAVSGKYGELKVFKDASGEWHYAYTLDQSHKGETQDESFSFTVRDAHGMAGTNPGVINIDLYNVNSKPVVSNVTAKLDTLRDADRMVDGAIAISDPDNDIAALVSASGPNGEGQNGNDDLGNPAFVVQGDHGVLYIYDDGTGTNLNYRYVLSDRIAGGIQATETFTYTVDDGFMETASGTICIDLSNVNNQPEISGETTKEIDTLRSNGQTSGNLVFTDPDFNVDKGAHDSVILSGVAFGNTSGVSDGQGGFTVNGDYGVFHIDALGAYTYELKGNAGIKDKAEEFTVTITDEFGLSREGTIRIDLVVNNHDPVVSAGNIRLDTWRDGGAASDSVKFTDADGDTVLVDSVSGASQGVMGTDPDNNPAWVVQGSFGMLYLKANGEYTYVLADNATGQSGTDTFTYTVDDGHYGSAQNTITINLDNTNANPVISGSLAATIQGSVQDYQQGIISQSGVFSWADADGDPIDYVTVGGQALAPSGETVIDSAYGVLVVRTNGGPSASWTYTMKPGMDELGLDDVESFGIMVADIYGGNSSRSLDITLKPLTHAPECEDVFVQWETMPNGKPVSFMEGQLEFSDADFNYGPETLHLSVNGTPVTESVQIVGQYGKLTIEPDGSFRYNYTVSSDNRDVLEDISYTVVDSKGFSDTAHLYIRLSDNAPEFPGTTEAQGNVVHEDAIPDSSDGTGMDAQDQNPQDSMPEPEDIELANVPLPYDPADTGSVIA